MTRERAAGGTPPSGAIPPASDAASAPSVDEALLIKAEEWASCGTEKYATWWKGLKPEQRKAIGTERHDRLKATAAKVPE